MWPTRRVAVALVGVRRSEDQDMASHTKRERKRGACRRPEPGKMRQHPTKPVATCAAHPRWSMRLERRTPQRKKAENNCWCPPPQPQHQPPRKRAMPELEGKQRRQGAASDRTVTCFGSPERRKANCAEVCHQTGEKERVQAQSKHEADREQSEQQVVG